MEKKDLPDGPAKNLRDVVYRLYAEADRPRLAELAQRIAGDDDLPGSPGRDLIGKIIGGDGLAGQRDTVTVAVALARAAGRGDLAPIADQVRQLWITAAMAGPPPQRGRYQHAIWLYRQAADRGDPGALRQLALLRDQAGDTTAAEALAVQAADRGDPGALRQLAQLREQTGDTASAEGLYRQAADRGDTDALRQLAQLREQTGDTTGAEGL
ncbi:hypothetical protein [Actinoplanes sp. NPDC049802]|uniref:tetratricopeptide repeat protein n=1 Tax=Actinoplanes sp. NPDC049802 TaxID=3154742 RepID=UPI0033DF1199